MAIKEDEKQTVYRAGIDVGSTTVKLAIMDTEHSLILQEYRWHYSDVRQTVLQLMQYAMEQVGNTRIYPVMTGSGGLALSQLLSIPFEQEVIAATKAIEVFAPETDVAIELGGEDAKITYFDKHGVDQRMNNSCAGGTGAFIDQMATLLETDAGGLNELAKNHKTVYPIASRCGVFAKTDVQPLINEGASKEDISASILQAIVNQTISGLACGKPIRGKVAFLGGPLNFLSMLRELFVKTLKLADDEVIFPENAKLFVAMGAAMLSSPSTQDALTFERLIERLEATPDGGTQAVSLLPPLFDGTGDLADFRTRHAKHAVKRADFASYQGKIFLGIDSGSTTTKAAVIGEQGELLYSFYSGNKGNPVQIVQEFISTLFDIMPATAQIGGVTATGYGEHLIKAAFKADYGEVETVAHYKAAERMLPGVEFILDIGGQDMKCLSIREGAIHNISLNEACSAGCGSFIETFAKSLHLGVAEFSQMALLARRPVDLGTRCTVFMNSNVKQAQKEGASVADISAGLSYAVIRNAIYKVIRLRRIDDLPQKIIVQGGTFYNEAVLRAFERLTGREVVRMDIAGLMGAYGAALIAMERYSLGFKSSFISPAELTAFKIEKSVDNCRMCSNRCRIIINRFADGREFISGNRCEKGANLEVKTKEELPNLYQYKLHKVFDYTPLSAEQSSRGTVGIPRVLNQYENYPFWHVFFTQLGFRVVLSPPSSNRLYQLGIDTIPSESACYPAKIVHGHIESLISRNVDRIFFPSVTYEVQEFEYSDNHFNCPVVGAYSEAIRCNVDTLQSSGIPFHNPFLNLAHRQSVIKVLSAEFKKLGIKKSEIAAAVEAAWLELVAVKDDIRKKGEETVEFLLSSGRKGIVLAGRPYHVDPGINHGIDKVIVEEGLVVLTEDSIAHLGAGRITEKLRVLDQWSYHSRLYAASAFVATCPALELVQLTSFGCGLDALTVDQVDEILQSGRKIYTLIKIDEGDNLGAARIRVRSLKAAMEERERLGLKPVNAPVPTPVKSPFTEDMKGYTILAPQMAPIHFDLLVPVFESEGYNVKVLSAPSKDALEHGLKYVHNDACYPCIMVAGQLIEAIASGEYDPNRTALIISQTGGQCRATNYISLLRKALQDMDCSQIPIISLNANGLEGNPGFKYTVPMLKKAIIGILYGDLLMRCLYRVRPYELEKGAANTLYEKMNEMCKKSLRGKSRTIEFANNVEKIIKAFDELPISHERKPRVGVVGEILVKFHPEANNYLVNNIEEEGGEAVVPDLLDFFLYCTYGTNYDSRNYGLHWKTSLGFRVATAVIERFRGIMRNRLRKIDKFGAPVHIRELAKMASSMVSLGNQAGEGWLLTAEMMELLEHGVNNIVCVQPFACLPNHITGRGMMKALKNKYPTANITAIDYDPGVSEVNQINRLKLMMSVARNAFDKSAISGSARAKEEAGNRNKISLLMEEEFVFPRV